MSPAGAPNFDWRDARIGSGGDGREGANVRANEITGMRFGKLVAQHRVAVKEGRWMWLLLCDCGAEVIAAASEVKRGNSTQCKSCRRNSIAKTLTIHGHSGTKGQSPEYRTWREIKRRCCNFRNKAYARYGGRGIKVCERWLHSFENFFADMGPRPPCHSIDRINNDGNYEPGNCRWATILEQNRNKSTTRRILIGGQSILLVDAAKEAGVNYKTALWRASHGWSPDQILK